jgi:type I restriction enzyme, S subunit
MLSPAAKTGIRPRPYLRNVNVQWGRFDLTEVAEMDFDPDEEEKFSLRPGDLLVCEGGEPGRAAVWQGEIAPCFYQKALHRLRPVREAVDSAFVMYRLWLGATSQEFGDSHARTTIAHLPAVRLAQLSIAVPALKVQRHIVAVLNAGFASVERARAAAEARLQAANDLFSTQLRVVFGGSQALAWRTRSVRELCERIDYGYTAPAAHSIESPRFLRITDIQDGRVDWDTVPGCAISPTDENAKRLADGDIVFARTGATTGKSFLLRQPPRAVFASYLIRLRPRREAVVPGYLYAFFQSDQYWMQVSKSVRGGAQPNVNATLLAAIRLPVPDIEVQHRVVAGLEEASNVQERLRRSVEGEVSLVEALSASLLRNGFNGIL